MDKSYRIHTNISSDTVLNVNMQQDYDFLEVLSLKLRQKDAYKLHSSNYGVIIGRVLANEAFGIPNARISVFIARDNDDASYLESIYPYTEVMSKDSEGRRYNLLSDSSDDDCYRIVGTFPNKRLVLDDDTYLEVYDKYWKYSTVTNNAGDYMIFGVPSGNQQIHVDLDLSDIGILSQKPRDFEYKGYNITMFDNPSQFKESTNLDSLAQIFSQNKSVFVYPFWGDDDNGIAAITRNDIEIQYKFEPTCVFMGSIVSDNEGNAIGHKCAPDVDNGMNDQLIAGQGTIEMIRKTTDGLVEEFQIQGNQLIDEDGVWCYQIPMNLDFVGTDEYGNIAPTDNPKKGIPTRTQVRFRISKNESGDDGFSRHTAKYLVPMNPIFAEDERHVVPTITINGQDVERMYTFGSNTPQSCFRDLYWNNVYSVKNYIPKVQVAHRPYSKNYGALKGSNLAEDQNPIPFNKLRVDIPFMYMIVCILFTVVMWIVSFVNLIICMIDKIFSIFNRIHNIKILGIKPFKWVPEIPYIGCVSLGGGLSEDNTAFYPSCECKEGLNASDCPSDMEGNCKKRSSNGALMDLVQQRLAEDYKIIKLDLYQDWINGCLYMPLWHWHKRKKKTFLFGLFSSGAKNEYCSCDKSYSRLKTYVTCNVRYSNSSLEVKDTEVKEKENNWHRSVGRARQVRYKNGLIKEVENKDGLNVYYYTALQARSDNREPNLTMDKRTSEFMAVRLYATDIILLGNLNENNLYGIPQFFKVLPSTTANVPPIASIEESIEDDENAEQYSQNEVAGREDSGATVTTGMDWGRNGDENSPQYKDGLFMDLACTYAHTKAKSCFNVERLSELGVNLDMTHNMSYAHNANDIQTGIIDSDGFITKYELEDMENRAMFATMNHIGFVPQEYQDSINGYTTQVEDKNTSYLVPKFRYIYPVDFDGRMNVLMNRYKNGFVQATFDDTDEAYLTFRLGADANEKNTPIEYNRVRHFYYASNGYFEMPLYNNSFYFYFGIKKGSTAIDKFNKLFYSECYKNDKKPFSYEINTKGRTYCPSIYNHQNDGYAYIRVTSDDIRTPFSYTLYDSNGIEIIHEDEMTDTDFVIGGYIDNDGNLVHNDSGIVTHHDEENTPVTNEYGTNGLTNQVYVLDIIDSDGRRQSERIKLDMDKITFDYVGQKLGTKFYNSDVSRIDYICNDENEFYGIIEITKFYVDSYEYKITKAKVITASDEKYVVEVEGEPVDENPLVKPLTGDNHVVFELYTVNANEFGVRDCMCDKGNSFTISQNISISKHEGNTPDYFYVKNVSTTQGSREFHFMFYVYQPNSFIGKIIQVCDNKELEENSTSEIMKIQNGKNFNTFLNTMPTRFIIGTTSDGLNNDGTVAIGNTSKFYSSKYGNSLPDGTGITGWFGAHQESTYQFALTINTTIPRNRDIWSDFLTIGSEINDIDTRKNILRYKFDKMFRVSDTAYLTTSNNNTFRYSAEGGVDPILYRSVVPFYRNYNMMLSDYIYGDSNYVSSVEEFPQVVGINYHEGGSDGPYLNPEHDNSINTNSPRFNDLYENHGHNGYIGNYFAAFTKNGRYTSPITGDCKTSIMALPNYAAVNLESNWKRLGKDLQKKIESTTMAKARENGQGDGECNNKRTQPYLRTLFIDRRLDYDLVFWAPSMGVDMKLHEDSSDPNIDKERPWKCARISGWTYGGIEMSYDEEDNIISANTDDTSGIATPNNRLEYSYYVDDVEENNAYTTYNIPGDGNVVWVNRQDTSAKYLYNNGDNDADGNKQYIKTLYEASINEIDARQLFWSDFNNTRLQKYIGWQESGQSAFERRYPTSADTVGRTRSKYDYYVFKHQSGDGFNGDFNYQTRTQYPTKRLIDIGNIAPREDYTITLTSCGYGMSPEVTEDGMVKSYIDGGDSVEINLQFSNPVEFIAPNADSKDYANAIMKKNDKEDGYVKFTVDSIDLDFRLNKVASNDFDVYTERPMLIKVLDAKDFNDSDSSTYHTDAITYIKAASPHDGLYGSNAIPVGEPQIGHVGGRIADALLYEFRFCNVRSIIKKLEDTFPSNNEVDIWWQTDEYKAPFYIKGKEFENWVTSDDNDFYNIEFRKKVTNEIADISNLYAFTVLVLRTYRGNDTEYLTRRIRTIETSSIYDTRCMLLKTVQNICVEDSDDPSGMDCEVKATYVTKTSGGTDVTVNGEVPQQEGEETETITSTGTVKTQQHTQTITFQMLNKCYGAPAKLTNQALADYDMMAFTFKFTDSNNNSYYLVPEVSVDADIKYQSKVRHDEIVNVEDEVKINFKLIFTEDMGILADTQWKNGTRVTVFAKTRDNFTYKLNEFRLVKGDNGNDIQPGYTASTRTSDLAVFDGTDRTRHYTNIKMEGL